MRAEIVCVGTELLIGQVVNTNATWLAQECARLGIDVHRVVTVGDNMDRLAEALSDALRRADLVVCTGGLGPTPDDLTIEAIGRVVGEPLVERPEALARLEGHFAARGRQMTELDRKQARFPSSAELIPNPAGTACGVALTRDGRRLYAFPGVPSELQTMWRAWAVARVAREAGATIRSTLLKFAGCAEAELAALVADLLDGGNPSVAPYTHSGEVHLRLTAKAASPEAAEALLAPLDSEIRGRAARFYFGRDDQTLPGVVGERLRAAAQTLAVAESASGGLLASRLTDVPGSSDYFVGGAVAYSARAKTALAGVPPEVVAAAGQVSRETTEALAAGIRHALDADWGCAITGYAGPGPGTPADRAGLMLVAIAGPDGECSAREHRFGNHPRDLVKHFATQRALDWLLRRLDQQASASTGGPVGRE